MYTHKVRRTIASKQPLKAGMLVDASTWGNRDRLVRLGYLEPLNIVTEADIAAQEAADQEAAVAAEAPVVDPEPEVEIEVEVVEDEPAEVDDEIPADLTEASDALPELPAELEAEPEPEPEEAPKPAPKKGKGKKSAR